MTIHELKALGERNGGLFFSRNNMKFAGDTMKSFSFKDNKDGTGTVTRKRDGTKWDFNLATGLVIHTRTEKTFAVTTGRGESKMVKAYQQGLIS